jgi:uncharacterized YigZ family protein
MLIDSYKTISEESKGLFKDRGSKFLSFAFPINSEEQVKDILQSLRKEYHDARHHCYAYRMGVEAIHYRVNDDGEPSGTAGKPIYGQIMSFELTNILVVVVRYFGGTLLGTSGLINAYRNATKDCLSVAKIVNRNIQSRLEIHFPYENMSAVMKVLKDEDASILEQKFDNNCAIIINIRKTHFDILYDRLQKITHVTLNE